MPKSKYPKGRVARGFSRGASYYNWKLDVQKKMIDTGWAKLTRSGALRLTPEGDRKLKEAVKIVYAKRGRLRAAPKSREGFFYDAFIEPQTVKQRGPRKKVRQIAREVGVELISDIKQAVPIGVENKIKKLKEEIADAQKAIARDTDPTFTNIRKKVLEALTEQLDSYEKLLAAKQKAEATEKGLRAQRRILKKL